MAGDPGIGSAAGQPLGTWLDALAGDRPTPGGGAAAAAAGAVAAALVAMVARGTVRHGGDATDAVKEAERLRAELTALIDDDVQAYQRVMEARRSPAPVRAEALGAALRRATDVPLAVARAGHTLLRRCETLAAAARVDALSDLEVAAALAAATVDGAVSTARANLRSLPADAEAIGREIGALVAEAHALRQRVGEHARRRVGSR